jgi:hypothetical protein
MVCFRYISVNTLHTGDNKDNNIIIIIIIIIIIMEGFAHNIKEKTEILIVASK